MCSVHKSTVVFLLLFLTLSFPGNNAKISSETNGALIFENVKQKQSNHFISDYTIDTVVINDKSETNNNNILQELQTGNLIAQIGLHPIEEEKTNKDECTPVIFRKIISRNYSANSTTYKTRLATFSDVFPSGSYDQSFSDIAIEPFFPKCKIESTSSVRLDDEKELYSAGRVLQYFGRVLDETPPADDDTAPDDDTAAEPTEDTAAEPTLFEVNSSFCQLVSPISSGLGLVTCCIPILLPAVVALIPTIIGFGATTSTAAAATVILLPLVPIIAALTTILTFLASFLPVIVTLTPCLAVIWLLVLLFLIVEDECDVTFSDVLGIFEDVGSSNSTENDRRLSQQLYPTLEGIRYGMDDGFAEGDENGKSDGSEMKHSSVPTKCSDWTSSSSKSLDGQCKYVDCNVGMFSDPNECYEEHYGNYESHASMMMEDMIVKLTGGEYDTVDFTEALCIQDYCYLSNAFDKETCDNSFHESLISTCTTSYYLKNSFQGEISPTPFIAMDKFPLDPSVLKQNCYMLSMLYYLSARVFGADLYYQKQQKQFLRNTDEVFCKKLS